MTTNIFEKITQLETGYPYGLKYSSKDRWGQATQNYIGLTNSDTSIGKAYLRSIQSLNQNRYSGLINRQERYTDYDLMDNHPIVSNALDVISDDIISQDFNYEIINIKTDDEHLKAELEHLFYDILDIEYNLWFWVRNCLKYGDSINLLYNGQNVGIVDVISLPINYVERHEKITKEGKYDIFFTFMGSRDVIPNKHIMNFRILGDEKFFPFGKSILEPIRRTWKQLRLLEDSMLVYRVSRAPERRIFYIEVGNMSPDNITGYINSIKEQLYSQPIVDPETGEIDLRYGPNSILDDFFIPMRGGVETNKIERLEGSDNSNAIDDVKYILNEIFSGLKVPKAFLNYEEGINSRSLLSSEDVRYSRTIQRYQKMIVNELYKVAYVHLELKGFSDDEMTNFTLNLFNPSQVATMQKLEILDKKSDLAGKMKDFFSEDYILSNIYEMSDQEIKEERIRRLNQYKFELIKKMMESIQGDDIKANIQQIASLDFDYNSIFSKSSDIDKAVHKIKNDTDEDIEEEAPEESGEEGKQNLTKSKSKKKKVLGLGSTEIETGLDKDAEASGSVKSASKELSDITKIKDEFNKKLVKMKKKIDSNEKFSGDISANNSRFSYLSEIARKSK